MAATGNEVPLLSQLLKFKEWIIEQLEGKAASNHNHSAANITTGTLPLARGGTGVTANPSMLVNLASTTADTVFEATPRPGVTGTLPISNGGTGATSASAARTAIGAASTSLASSSVNGLMSSSDKTKLDGMSSHLFNVPVVLRGNTTMSGLNFTLTMTLASNIEDSVTLHQGDTVFVADASQDTFGMASTGGVYVLLAPEMVINPYSGVAASALFAPVYDLSMSIGSNVDIVRVSAHKTSYDKDTLEIVTDSTGKVTSMYFVSA